jgi:ketosteroid isomerase-like protein
MKKMNTIALFAALFGICNGSAFAAGITETELMRAATDLGHQYDSHYAAKDPDGMASVYAADGVLISPLGPIVRGRAAIRLTDHPAFPDNLAVGIHNTHARAFQ